MATKSIKKANKTTVKSSVSTVNNFVLDTAELIVDETLDRASAWQDVTEKEIYGGFKLAKAQSDLTFKALETLKRQWSRGQEKFMTRIAK